MERKKEKNYLKIFNRGLTYILLFVGITGVCYSVKQINNYIKVKKENTELNEMLNELKEENEKLEIVNQKLKDSEYFSVYVKGKYQYSSNNNSIIPIK